MTEPPAGRTPPGDDDRLKAFLTEVGRRARAERESNGLPQQHFASADLPLATIEAVEAGDIRVTLTALWIYSVRLRTRVSDLVPRDEAPFDDVEALHAARTERLTLLRRSRRTTFPRMRRRGEVVRFRSTGPGTTESELVQEQPDFEAVLPAPVTEARERLDNAVAAEIHDAMATLGSTFDAFLATDSRLAATIHDFANPRSAWLHHPFNHEKLDAAFGQVAENVQNYVAAAGALLDHTRRFRNKYVPKGTPPGNEYDERIATTFAGAAPIIVKALRNYAMHYGIPMLAGEQREVTADGWGTALYLDSQTLLTSGFDWKPEERAILHASPDWIPLGALVEMYSARVVSFYRWLAMQIPRWHADAEQERERLEREWMDALRAAGLGDLPGLIERLDRRKRGYE